MPTLRLRVRIKPQCTARYNHPTYTSNAKNARNIESNPFEESDPRYNEWIECFNKYKSELLETFLPESVYFAFYSELADERCGHAVYTNKATLENIKVTGLFRDINAKNYLWEDKKLVGEIDLNLWYCSSTQRDGILADLSDTQLLRNPRSLVVVGKRGDKLQDANKLLDLGFE